MIPKEISEELARQEHEILLDIREYVDRLIAEQESSSDQEEFNKGEESEREKTGSVTYRQEWVYCGKDCSRCPHGPYWYAYWKENGKTHSKYIGKELGEETEKI